MKVLWRLARKSAAKKGKSGNAKTVNTRRKKKEKSPGNKKGVANKSRNSPAIRRRARTRPPEEIARYQKAKLYADFATSAFKELDKPLRATLEQMMDALIYGHKIAEVTYKLKKFAQFNDGSDMLVPYKIKVKPRGTVRFVVDRSMNVIGLAANSSLTIGEPLPVDEQGKAIPQKAAITTDSNGNALIGGSKLLTRELLRALVTTRSKA